MNKIPHWLEKRVHLTPNQTALQFKDGSRKTFAELRTDALDFAKRLHTLGIKKGDHVSLLSNNCYEMVISIHAFTYVEAKVVLLNTRLSKAELLFQFQDSNSRYLIYQDSLVDKTKSIREKANIYSFTEVHASKPSPLNYPEEMDLNDLYTIIYTSGTTGFPKGVQLTFGNHFWSATSSALNLGLHENDRWLATLPLFHVGGLSVLIKSLLYGMPVHLHESFSTEDIHREIMEEGVTIVSVVTVMLERLSELLMEGKYPESFRCMLLGGGPAPKPLLEICKEKGIPVFQTYGMTETSSQIATLTPTDALRKLGSAGKALFPAQLKIMNENKEAKPNEVGEIIVKGPMVTAGYYNREDANKSSITNEWLRTGDLAYVDEEGYLYVKDRRKDLIISGGENVYPAEIEAVLKGMESVLDAGVVGVKDDKWGQVPVAFLVLNQKESSSKEEIHAYLEERLAKYKIPKAFYFVKELPRNASNKLMRRSLLQWLDEGVYNDGTK
jgi:o-succinylbenzoate---CoA ligase